MFCLDSFHCSVLKEISKYPTLCYSHHTDTRNVHLVPLDLNGETVTKEVSVLPLKLEALCYGWLRCVHNKTKHTLKTLLDACFRITHL